MKSILGRLKRRTTLPDQIDENIASVNNDNKNVEVELGNKINKNEDNYNSNANFLTKNEDYNLINANNQFIAGNNIKEKEPQILAENINNINPITNNNNQQPNTNPNPIIENKIQTEFKNIFQGKDFFSNNKHRRRLMYMSFTSIIIDALILQILW